MKALAVRILFLGTIGLACLVGSCSKKPSEPEISPELIGTAIFVAPGGTGNGTYSNPYGSIQKAIDSAWLRDPMKSVVIATGEYHESITLRSGVNISGGRDRTQGWNIHSSDSTVIVGNELDGFAHTANGRGLRQPTSIDHVCFMGPPTTSPGTSSIAVCLSFCDSVSLADCSIRGGRGTKGEDGAAGSIGESSANKARGGAGGRPRTQTPCWGGDGSPGNCYPDSLYAGMGGTGGSAGYSYGFNGGAGLRGSDGNDGTPAPALVELVMDSERHTLRTSTGTDGSDGGWGCGGGGGGALSATPNHADTSRCNPGYGGTSGGSGGGGGTHGTGGRGGGSSVGLLLIDTHVTLSRCIVSPRLAGVGGNGGAGGSGAAGAPGAPTSWGDYPVGIGGKGGDGGNGGSGGGGMGGCAFAIAYCRSVITRDSTTVIEVGIQGSGGGPTHLRGPSGINALFHEFDSVLVVSSGAKKH